MKEVKEEEKEFKRKVQQVGGASFVITLPKGWADKWHIKKGSTVIIEEGVGGSLIVSPSKPREPLMIEIAFSRDETQSIQRKIFAAYLEGYDVIEIRGEPMIRLKDRKILKEFVSRFPGLEIMEEESDRLVLRCVLDPSMLEPKMLFERMNKLVSSMLEDLLRAVKWDNEELLSLVMDRDDEVDRVYFLLVRVIRKASQDAYLMRRLKTDPIQLIDLRVSAMLLEAIADRFTELAEVFRSNKIGASLLKEMGNHLIELLKASLESVIKRDVSLAIKAKERAQEMLKSLLGITITSPEESAIIFTLREIVARLADLCDLVSP